LGSLFPGNGDIKGGISIGLLWQGIEPCWPVRLAGARRTLHDDPRARVEPRDEILEYLVELSILEVVGRVNKHQVCLGGGL